MILPWPTATISIQPKQVHRTAVATAAMMVQRIARPIGDGGACWISRTAGRNSVSRLDGTERRAVRPSISYAARQIARCREIVRHIVTPPRAARLDGHGAWHTGRLTSLTHRATLPRRVPPYQEGKSVERAGPCSNDGR